MPQKKNAVVAEMVRAKAGSVVGDLVAACAILKALPYSYNLDLQEVTPQLWRGLDDAVSSVRVLAGALSTAAMKRPAHPGRADNSTSVGLANYLVRERGVSFRQAHAVVGELVRISLETGRPLRDVAPAEIAAVSPRFGKRLTLDGETARRLLEPAKFLEGIATEGGSNPGSVAKGLGVRRKELSLTRRTQSELATALAGSGRKLRSNATGIAREVKERN